MLGDEHNCIEPLSDIREDSKSFILTIDLPFVNNKNDISIDLYGDIIEVTAKTIKNIRWERLGGHRSTIEYHEYRKRIKLPRVFTEDSVTASFRNGVLKIVIDKGYKKREIKFKEEI
ncbi:MAG: Hsp20/alpha crystallin family protein [Nitrososphaerota archaeon]|nr:Hsp20/alpha crystallin family protein [Nitrososphaerota archaeon]MDG7046032.1 Hsp20/alpha crystallin family protein [Nitrososphaerota archaeon]